MLYEVITDYFLGAGLRFADEEIRGLVGLVPLAGN